MEALGKLGINPAFLLSQIVNFVILFIILSVLVWKPFLRMMDERRQRIQKGIEDAEAASRERARAEQEYEKRLAEARREADKMIAEARQKGESAREEVLAEARARAEKVVSDGRETVERERQRMLADLRGQVAALAVAAANKLIGEALDEQRQRRLIDELFSGIRAGRVVVLDEQELRRAKAGEVKATVTSALPLSADEQKVVSSGLAEQLGWMPAIEFKVDPALLGGLVIRIGDKVIDGSVSGRLGALRESLA